MVFTLPPTSRASKHSFFVMRGPGFAWAPADSKAAPAAPAGASAYIRWNRVPVGRLLGRMAARPADSSPVPPVAAGRRTS